MKRLFVIFACVLAAAVYGSSKRDIPDVRVRIVDSSGAPFQWVHIGQVGYHKLPMSQWPSGAWSEESKRYVCTLARNGFFKTEDGWITVKGVRGRTITEYRVTIVPPAAGELEFKDKEWEALAKCAGTDCTLTTHYVHDGHILAYFGGYYNYNQCQYYIAAYEKYLRCWPELAAAKEDSHITGRSAPFYKGYYFGLLYEYLRFIADKLEPIPPVPPERWTDEYYEEDGYTTRRWSEPVPASVKTLPGYPPGYVPLTDEQRKEMWDHIKAFVCQDLQEKKAQWGGMVIPWDLWSQPSFQRLRCEGFDLEPKPADATPAPPTRAAPLAQDKSAPTSAPQPPPAEAPGKH